MSIHKVKHNASGYSKSRIKGENGKGALVTGITGQDEDWWKNGYRDEGSY